MYLNNKFWGKKSLNHCGEHIQSVLASVGSVLGRTVSVGYKNEEAKEN